MPRPVAAGVSVLEKKNRLVEEIETIMLFPPNDTPHSSTHTSVN